MPFPNPPRTVYQRNPLEEVICQLRFPPILRIDAEPAAAFQERIRVDYPLYEEQPIVGVELPPKLAQLINLSAAGGQVQREFSSQDQNWKITLTRDFLALTARSYERWEGYRGHLTAPLAVLEEEYEPAFYTRIGLRYKNVFRRSRLALDGVKWRELLSPHIAAELAVEQVLADVRHAAHQVAFAIGQFNATAQVRHGLTDDDDEQCYTIDADFFTTDRTERANALSILDYFNEEARRLFHWCISERLHTALEPAAVAV